MKKIFLLFLILTLVPLVSADTITEVMEDADEYYYLVLGDNALGGDVSSATEVVLGLFKHNNLNIETVLEGEISENLPRILIGPPCGSAYMEQVLGYPCDSWPYEEGQSIIKVDGNNIIVTGTTPNDRRRSGLILREYIDHEELSNYSFVLVTGTSLEPSNLKLEQAKTKKEFVCGDNLCEPGEAFLCFPDCNKKTCFDVCNEDGFEESFCREIPSNPNVNICQEDESNKGLQYCASEKSCCCKSKGIQENTPLQAPPQVIKEQSRIEAFLNGESAGLIVTISLVIIGFIILLAFIITR